MNEKLQEIKMENLVIFIYFILLITYLYANTIEVNYLEYQNIEDKEHYRTLLYIVFGTSLLITFYYTINSIIDLQEPTSKEILKLKELSAISNVLILVATIIYLYIIYKDKNINLEVSP